MLSGGTCCYSCFLGVQVLNVLRQPFLLDAVLERNSYTNLKPGGSPLVWRAYITYIV